MFEATVEAGVLRLVRPDCRWLSTGWDGGFVRADAAYNVSVPEGWERTDLDRYVAERRARAGFDADGPALLTGVDLVHARGARSGPAVAYVTAGVSNPAALPAPPTPAAGDGETETERNGAGEAEAASADAGGDRPAGTVNVFVGTTRSLDDAALANLLAVAVEAKAATLLAETGFPGTTTDAAVAASDPGGEPAPFAGSATAVGDAARACVRDALRASLRSRYRDERLPESVEAAEHGVVTDRRSEVFAPWP